MLDWVNVSQCNTFYRFDFRPRHLTYIPSLEAAHLTIKKITQNYPPPYTLFLSGGVDSQALLWAWITSGEKFNTWSAVYNFKSNWHDLETLDEFSKIHKIKINYVDFDLLKFLDQEHDYYANTYICGSPQITTFMKLASLNFGTSIMSGNFIRKVHCSNKYQAPIDHNNFGLYHYAKKSNLNFIPFFFLETSELAYSFQNDNLENQISKIHWYDLKVFLYRKNGYPVIKQEEKYNGFEKIKEYFDTKEISSIHKLKKLSSIPNQFSRRNFDILYRNFYEAKFSNYKYEIIC